jgi:hypothetical protein
MSSRLDWHGDRIQALIREAAERGLAKGADIVADTAQQRVPEQTGELKRSQRVEAEGLRAVIAYDDSKAAAAHENLTVSYRRGRQSKFLESAAHDRRADVRDAVADEIRNVL